MNFLNLAAFGFSGLIPIVILLYLLKIKRKNITVSSVLFWKKAVKDLEASTPFQRLRRNLLLVLQLLILLLLILALARPFFRAEAKSGQNIILILDCSASMQSKEMGLSRFDQARKAALRLVNDLSENDKLMIIAAGSKTRVVSIFTSDKEVLRKALAELEPLDTSTNLKDAYLLAASTSRTLAKTEVFILSDGAVEELPRTELSQVHFLQFGKPARNLAITALDVRRKPASQYDYEVFVTIENFSIKKEQFYLGLYLEDKLVDAVHMDLAAGGKKSHIFSGFSLKGEMLRVEIDAKDDLEVDNRTWAVLEPRQETSILLVTNRNPFLQKTLNLDPGTKVSVVSPDNYTSSRGYDLTVLDNFAPAKLEDGDYLFINPSPNLSPLPATGYLDGPVIVDWERTHPLLRFVDFSDVHIARAMKLKSISGAKSLVEADGGGLIWLMSRENSRIVLVGFDLYDSDWVLRASFPIFVSNLLHWLTTDILSTSFGQIQSGQVLSLSVGRDQPEVNIINPRGQRSRVLPSKGNIYFDQTEEVGLYEVQLKGKKRFFAVNLLNSQESKLDCSASLKIGKQTVEASTSHLVINREVWSAFLMVGLCVLMVEWFVYHRRI